MYKTNDNIVEREIHGSFFLIDITDNYRGDRCALYEINRTGMFLWKNLSTAKTADELTELLKAAIIDEKEVLFITFTGGDIFTRKDFLDIYLYAKRKGFIIELYTNGALITEKDIQVFSQYPPLLVDISLYGSCEETYRKVTGISGAFEKVILCS